MDLHAVSATGIAQEAAVVMAVGIVQENRTTIHTALGHMHRDAGYFQTGSTRHWRHPGCDRPDCPVDRATTVGKPFVMRRKGSLKYLRPL